MTPRPAPDAALQVVTFRLEDRLFGFPLESVVRVERAAAVTPLPGAPPSLLGALNHRGTLMPVVDLRRRLRLPERPLDPADQFVLVRCGPRTVVVPVDHVEGLRSLAGLVRPEALTEAPLGIDGLVASEEGVLVVQDAMRLLNPCEDQAFDEALDRAGAEAGVPEPG